MFTFIYSKSMPIPTREQKQKLSTGSPRRNRISELRQRAGGGPSACSSTTATTRDEYNLSSRTNGGTARPPKGGSSLIGKFIDVKITASNTWALYGEIV